MKWIVSLLLFLMSTNLYAANQGTCGSEKLRNDVQSLFKKHMIYGLKVEDFNFCEIEKQSSMFENKISFTEALDEALESFLNDGEDLESPLHIVFIRFYHFADYETFPKEYIKDLLLFALNASNAKLNLVPIDKIPEGGESAAISWRFRLSIENLSDHLHWAIVNRLAEKETYNYGFN